MEHGLSSLQSLEVYLDPTEQPDPGSFLNRPLNNGVVYVSDS